MLMIDADGVIRYANRQVTALFGYSHDQVIGRRVEDLMPERFRERHVRHRESYQHNIRLRPMGAGLELSGRRQDGSEFPVEISLSPVSDGQRLLFAATIRDSTDRKAAQTQLIVARETADAARALADQARELADRANLGKSRFLATASHDLRQPLQTLALLNGTLRRLVSDANALTAVEQQEQAISAMSRLLNALLDISKLESGAIKPEPTDFEVASIFKELRTEFSTIAANKGLKLEVRMSADRAYSDPSLVGQILRNLLSNAIKYTREGWVRLSCLHNASNCVRIEVLDTGIGIPPDQIDFIYDEFYQVGVPANSSRDGYGLGLSIVQRLVKLLTLKLDVRSEIGRGSAFLLSLPKGSERGDTDLGAGRGAGARAGPGPRGKAHVLLVEDDPAVRGATSMLLRVEGYEVTAVDSLAQALEHAHDGIDLVISDYHLREAETGIQVITALRDALGASLKAVLMTGDTSSAIRELPRDPLLRVASKPIEAEELLSLLRALLAA